VENLKKWLGLHKKEVLFGAAIFFASSLSFALGYIANREYDHSPIIIQACSNVSHDSSSSRMEN
jgi:hypothetical protein